MADTIAESKLVPEPTTAALSLLALAGLAAAAAVSVSGDRAGDCSLWIFFIDTSYTKAPVRLCPGRGFFRN